MKQVYAELLIMPGTGEWKIVEASEAFIRMSGYTRAELTSEAHSGFLTLLSPESAEALRSGTGTQYGRETGTQADFAFETAGGAKLHLQAQAEPAPGREGCARLCLLDITEGYEYIGRLRGNLSGLAACIPGALCKVRRDDAGLTVLWHNERFLEFVGLTAEQLAAETLVGSNYVYADDLELLTQRLDDFGAGRDGTLTMELRIVRLDGEERNILLTMSPTGELDDGKQVFYFLGIDITQYQLNRELQQSAERYNIAMAQSNNCVWEYDLRTKRLETSESTRRVFGLSELVLDDVPESIIAMGVVHADSVEDCREMFALLQSGRPQVSALLRLKLASGKYAWMQVKQTAVSDGHGALANAVGLAEDVTEKHEIEMRFREEENLREAMNYNAQFICQIDVTGNQVLRADGKALTFYREGQLWTPAALIRRAAETKVFEEDRERFIRTYTRDRMMGEYERGVPEIQLDYRRGVEDGGYRWYRATTHIIREPVRGNLYAYIYTKDIDDEKRRDLALRTRAETDTLTQLYNRLTLELRVDAFLKVNGAQGRRHAVYMVDLDNFKGLNDTYGHERGDEALIMAGKHLHRLFDKNALLGRMGGDEFMALWPDCGTADEALEKGRRICAALHETLGDSASVSASVGLAFAPQHGSSFSELYHCADIALYQAKREGKNCCALYGPELRDSADNDGKTSINRDWLLDEANDVIYVADFYNYDLLYMNRGARAIFHVEGESYKGHKCYEVLQGKTGPCEFCSNHLLNSEEFYTWEFKNEGVGHYFMCKDRVVDWYGVPARIEFATDITKKANENRALESQVSIDKLLIECLRDLSGRWNLEQAMNALLCRVGEFYRASRAYVVEKDAEDDTVSITYEWDREGVEPVRTWVQRLPLSAAGPMAEAFSHGEIYSLDDSVEERDGNWTHRFMTENGVGKLRMVPMETNSQVSGCIVLHDPQVMANELNALRTLPYFISEETVKRRLAERLIFLGYHDPLTGLLNRNRYTEYLRELEQRAPSTVGVVVADINALKETNKKYGHASGDLLVKEAAKALLTHFREGRVFRLSGDEFVVIVERATRADFVAQAKAAREGVRGIGGTGVALGHAWADTYIDVAGLVTHATEMMLLEKQNFYKDVDYRGKRDSNRLQHLLDILRKGYFKVFLQPRVDCRTGALSGAEALSRYDDGEHANAVQPDKFIDALEKDRTIKYLDLFVFEEVCRLLARWGEEGRELVPISLNFSRLTLMEPGLIATIDETRERYGVAPELIEIEITETLGELERDTVVEISTGLRGAGYRLALDDFGSHYTNLAMLMTVPLNTLKLDREMIGEMLRSVSNRLVLQHVLQLCTELGVSSVAEGVETEEELALLKALHCNEIQGYLFGRPMPSAEFERKYF